MLTKAGQAFAWCWGAGWDSTAGIIESVKRGHIPDLISFANTGGEKNKPDPSRGEQIGTYDFIPVFTEWLLDHGCPAPVICEYQPKENTTARYLKGARDVVQRLGLKVPEQQIINLSKLYGNMVANHTLPGIAFGPKSCSIKWKLEAQEPI